MTLLAVVVALVSNCLRWIFVGLFALEHYSIACVSFSGYSGYFPLQLVIFRKPTRHTPFSTQHLEHRFFFTAEAILGLRFSWYFQWNLPAVNCQLHNSVGEWGAGNWVIQVFFNSFVFQKDYIQVHVGRLKKYYLLPLNVVIARCNIFVNKPKCSHCVFANIIH